MVVFQNPNFYTCNTSNVTLDFDKKSKNNSFLKIGGTATSSTHIPFHLPVRFMGTTSALNNLVYSYGHYEILASKFNFSQYCKSLIFFGKKKSFQ